MYQTHFSKALYLLIALVLSACQAQPAPTAKTWPTVTLIHLPTTTPVPTLTADEVAIRAARQALNDTFAQRDFAALVKHLAFNANLDGPALQAHSAGEIRTFFQSITNSRPDLILAFDPNQIQLNLAWGLASENGNWHETWSERGALTTLDGTYTAMWRKANTTWLMQAQVFIPLTCKGSNYCNH